MSIISRYINSFDRCKLIKCECYGYAYQRNIGVLSACGEYILFVSGDVICQKGMIKRYFNYIEADVDIVQGTIIQEAEEDALDRIVSSFYSRNKDSIGNQISTVNILIRRELLIRYPMDESYPAFEDKLWYIELPVAINYIRGMRCIVYHKVHEGIAGYAEKIRREGFAVGIGLRKNKMRWKCYNFFNWVIYGFYALLYIAFFLILVFWAAKYQNILILFFGGAISILLVVCYIYTAFIRKNGIGRFSDYFILFLFMMSAQRGILQGFFKR